MYPEKLTKTTKKNKSGRFLWQYRCCCGNLFLSPTWEVNKGKTRSCGCIKKQHLKSLSTHNLSKSSTYFCWQSMKQRCYNPNTPNYSNYGGRGITVCDRWKNSFENFLCDMGERPEGMEIDRINNNGDYQLDNCRWVSKETNNRNRRSTVIIEYQGVEYTQAELCRKFNISPDTFRYRIKRGKTVEEALFKGKYKGNQHTSN